MEIFETLLIACVPAIISGIISYILAKSQAKSENEKLRLSNQHEIDRLMEQHKVDNGMFGGIMNSPEVQAEMSRKILE